MIKRYIKKPIVIEAVQFDGWNWREVYQFMSDEPLMFTQDFRKDEFIIIETLEGDMKANVGDYIIKGILGEFYPCQKGIFELSYEEVAEEPLYYALIKGHEKVDDDFKYWWLNDDATLFIEDRGSRLTKSGWNGLGVDESIAEFVEELVDDE